MKRTFFLVALGLLMSAGTMQAQGAVGSGSVDINAPGVGVGITVGEPGYGSVG
ncbi:MAG: hypothetical protein J6P53_03610 [Mailhella sp.]|nr:hypothetical protein [Mailhella sp.]